MSTVLLSPRLQSIVDAINGYAAPELAALRAEVEHLRKENTDLKGEIFALRSGWVQTQAKIRALLPGPDFRGLMKKIQALTQTGALSADQIDAALAGVGLKREDMAQLISNAPLIAGVDTAVDMALAGGWIGPPTHKGISIDAFFKQGWTIEQLRKDGYQGPERSPPSMTIPEAINSGRADWPPGSGKYHHLCGRCGKRFEMKHQQMRHARLGHRVYCSRQCRSVQP